MIKKKCSLCGGHLINNRCALCGLDNSIYDRTLSRRQSASSQSVVPPAVKPAGRAQEDGGRQSTASGSGTAAHKQQTVYSRQPTAARPASRKRGSSQKKRGCVIWIIILAVILFAVLPSLIKAGSSIFGTVFSGTTGGSYYEDDSYSTYDNDDSDYDPYGYVTREIPTTGETYETVLGSGIYRVGVHIPEGIYRAELVAGAGGIQISDEENGIYHYVIFGTEPEYDQVAEEGDIRLYNGASLNIDGGVILRFTTENAQPLIQEIKENPLSEPVSLDAGTYTSGEGTLPEGIYDISAVSMPEDEYGYSSVTLTYPNGFSEYLWVDSSDYAPVSDEYTDTGVKNIVVPDGTEISVEYGSVIFTPSDGYYDVDYAQYTSE